MKKLMLTVLVFSSFMLSGCVHPSYAFLSGASLAFGKGEGPVELPREVGDMGTWKQLTVVCPYADAKTLDPQTAEIMEYYEFNTAVDTNQWLIFKMENNEYLGFETDRKTVDFCSKRKGESLSFSVGANTKFKAVKGEDRFDPWIATEE